ncbi:type II toxin-antitoxin system Phd/YefM family antitoxin [Levilactobacillus tujiorum]|uniref:Antitoxin n=1 Tax=Levilactobacillus tujiorum TaxID=2912243 RepID=A0ABX1L5J3_9LACO|nr:hypothetical protein [Levilactobacillus tujiorum]MCH5464122.1 hypothetical protein [Levilactobacillus tujiorum]NLR11221.1 hypothetical protein [Lactobacillus sp. HBUAS51387]NLR29152.1 hypothetical protein [Levilactobacillus tujiorum]
MKTTYSLTDAQQNFLALMQTVNAGTPVKIEGNHQGAVLLSADRWAAIQQQLTTTPVNAEQRHRAALYRAWGHL